MKIFKIATDKEPIVRATATEVPLPVSDVVRKTLLEMIDYLKASQNEELSKKYQIRSGVGIAAPQIFISQRFFALCFDDDGIHYEYGLVNPRILSTSVKKGYLTSGEGCLSVPVDVKGYVYRYFKITAKAFDVVSNKEITLRLTGYPAMVFQHEYDHLDGILYYDRINKANPLSADPNAVPIE
jgi:peptide deformylase